MTISADYVPGIDLGNGVTTAFPVNFPFGAKTDLLVTLFDTTTNADVSPAPVLNGASIYDYAVSGTPNVDTGIYPNGTVTFNTAPPGTYKVVRERMTPQRQNTSLTNNGPFPAKTVEGSFDRQEMQLQERSDTLSRALVLPSSDGPIDTVLDAAGARAGYLLAFDLTDGRPRNSAFTEAQIGALLAGGVPPASSSLLVYTSVAGSLALADAAAFALAGELVIDTNITLAANTTVLSKQVRFAGGKIIRGSFTLTFNGYVVAPSVAIFDKAGSGLVTMANGLMDVKWFGAVGDFATNALNDDTNPLLQCMASSSASMAGTTGSTVYWPGGRYGTTLAIPKSGPWQGDGSNASALAAKSTFAGSYLVDMAGGTESNRISGLTLDVTALGSGGTTSIYGSSSSGHANGSACTGMDDVTHLSLSLTVHALNIATPGFPEAWYFTGLRAYGIRVIAPLPISFGIGDDIIITGARLQITAGATSTAPFDIQSTNTKMISTYLFSGSAVDADGGLISMGSGLSIDGLFLEGSQKLAWIFQLSSGSLQGVKVQRVEFNYTMTGSSAQKALIRLNTHLTVSNYGFEIDTANISSGAAPCDTLFSIFNTLTGAVSIDYTTLRVRNCNIFGTLAKAGSGGNANANPTVWIEGNFRQTVLQHLFTCPSSGSYVGSGARVDVGATY